MHDRLDPDLICANLRTKLIGRKVLVFDRTASTNDIAAEYARNPEHNGLVVFAEEQTAGRGRTGAKWHSDHGLSLLFSIALTDCPVGGELLPLACAVAVAEAVGRVGSCQATVKWPNDILLAGRKIAGILVESSRVPHISPPAGSDPCPVPRAPSHESRVASHAPRDTRNEIRDTAVIGIGINCHQTPDDFPPELRETATSLDIAAGARCDRITVARRVLTSLDHWLEIARQDKKKIIETWSRLSTQLGQRVTLSYNRRRYTGNCIGVDPEKGLILQLDRGGIRMFPAAQTSVVRAAHNRNC